MVLKTVFASYILPQEATFCNNFVKIAQLRYNKDRNNISYDENTMSSFSARSKILPPCSNTDICGDNGGACERAINDGITRDGGNIDIKINSIEFTNAGTSIVPTGTNGVGTQDPNTGRYTCGITTITHSDVILCPNDATEGCSDIQINYICNIDTKKCKLSFEYKLKVEMEINVWDPQVMCATMHNIAVRNNNYNLDLPSPSSNTNCCWFHRSVKHHESWHCRLWTMAWERLRANIDNEIPANLRAIECSCDDECKEQAELLNVDILGKISVAMFKTFRKQGAGNYQEGTCYAEQDSFFLRYVNRPCQL